LFPLSLPPPPPLFPYTTLFRSLRVPPRRRAGHSRGDRGDGQHHPRLVAVSHLPHAVRELQRHHLGRGLGGQRRDAAAMGSRAVRSEEHTSELQSLAYLVCRLLL